MFAIETTVAMLNFVAKITQKIKSYLTSKPSIRDVFDLLKTNKTAKHDLGQQ